MSIAQNPASIVESDRIGDVLISSNAKEECLRIECVQYIERVFGDAQLVERGGRTSYVLTEDSVDYRVVNLLGVEEASLNLLFRPADEGNSWELWRMEVIESDIRGLEDLEPTP